MKMKKVIAMLLCIALVIGMLPTSTFGANASEENEYYVSINGSDSNEGTEVNPFQTISKAVSKLKSSANGIVKIIGEYEISDDDFSSEHSGNIVIEGADTTSKLKISNNVSAKSGPYVIRNIDLNYPNGSRTFFACGNEVTFGTGITTSGNPEGWWAFQNIISAGGSGVASYNESHKFSIDSGDYYRLYIGNGRLTDGQKCTIPGVDFVMNGGHVYQFILGGDGWDGMWGTNNYTDNVNLTFNGGSIGTNGLTLVKYGVNNTYFQGGTDLNGNAIQIIMNNGLNIPLDPGITEENVKACNGELFILKVAKQDGNVLEVTKTSGTYKVKGNLKAVATDGTNTYKSEDGLLTVPEGEYTVSWEAPNVYYVSANGSDTNSGSEGAPLATIAKAITGLSGNASSNCIVNVIGEYSLTSADLGAQHDNRITIKGVDETSRLVINENLKAGGKIVFEDIDLNYSNRGCTIYANGNDIVYGKGLKITGQGNGWWDYQNMISTGYNGSGTYNSSHNLTVNSGDFYRLYIGESRLTTGYSKTIPGVNFLMNGGQIYQFLIAGDGWDGTWGTNSYTANVNLTFNGGSVGDDGICLAGYGVGSTPEYFKGETDFNGNALQIIMNNGVDIPLNEGLTAENVSKCNGQLYVLRAGFCENCELSPTKNAGEFAVKGNRIARATDKKTGEIYKSKNGVLTVAAGEYVVDWEKIPDQVYLDYELGNDGNDGKTVDTPVKTFGRAIELSKNKNNPRIVIVNKGLYDGSIDDNEDITVYIVGDNDDSIFAYGGTDIKMKSDLVLDNVILYQDGDNSKIYTKGHNLTIGQNVTFSHGEHEGLENPIIVTGKEDNYERIIIAGTGCAGITIGDDGVAAKDTRIILNNTYVDKIEINAKDAEAKIRSVINGGKVNALVIPNDATFDSVQLVSNNGGSIVGNIQNDNTWYIENVNEEGTNVSLTNKKGQFNVTVPGDKVAVAINEKGNNAYVAGDKTNNDLEPKTNYKKTKYTDWGCFDNNGSYLFNTYNKLKKDNKLTVAFFGGSLTNGYGCGLNGDPNGTTDDGINRNAYSWRALSCNWLKENFPQANITTIDAAIGESGTYLGTFRVQDDIIKLKPDLLFVEYAINDNYFGSTKEQAASQFETIVREVKEKLPDCDIITVLTTDIVQMEKSYNGELFETAQGHNEIAKKYGLPVVNIGKGLAKGIAEEEKNSSWWNNSEIWDRYFCDVVHPYSTGHRYYYLCMEEFLENNLLYTDFEGTTSTRYVMPEVQSDSLFDGERKNIYGEDMKDFYVAEGSSNANFNEGIFVTGTSDTPRKGYYEIQPSGSITFDFEGTEFTVWSNVNGNFKYKVDDEETKEVIASTHAPTRVASGLQSGKHRITLMPTEYMQIAGIFTRDETKETKKGTGYYYNDYNGMTLNVPAGKYVVHYVNKVGDLPMPECEEDKVFAGWSDGNGNIIPSNQTLTKGMSLTATFKDKTKFVVEIFDIKDYYSSIPTPKNEKYKDWLFAGWYEDEECSEYIWDKNSVLGMKYAKFVNPEILTIKAQLSSETTKESQHTSMRIISSVDSLVYKKVGFEITRDDKVYDYEIAKVYKVLTGIEGDLKFNYNPNIFSGSSEYFSTVILNNISKSDFDKEMCAKPYWVTMDGTKVFGKERILTVEEGLINK